MCVHVHKRVIKRETQTESRVEGGMERELRERERERELTNNIGRHEVSSEQYGKIMREDWGAVAEMTAYSSAGT